MLFLVLLRTNCPQAQHFMSPTTFSPPISWGSHWRSVHMSELFTWWISGSILPRKQLKPWQISMLAVNPSPLAGLWVVLRLRTLLFLGFTLWGHRGLTSLHSENHKGLSHLPACERPEPRDPSPKCAFKITKSSPGRFVVWHLGEMFQKHHLSRSTRTMGLPRDNGTAPRSSFPELKNNGTAPRSQEQWDCPDRTQVELRVTLA